MALATYSSIIFSIVMIAVGWASAVDPSCEGDNNQQFIKTLQGKMVQCADNHLNMSHIQAEWTAAMMTDTLPAFMKSNCPKIHHSLKCLDQFLEDLGVCLDPAQKYAKKIVSDMVHSVVDFLCYDDGRRILEFIKSGGLQCTIAQKDNFAVCITSNKEVQELFDIQGLTQGTLPTVSPTVMSGKECRVIHNASECFLGIVKSSCSKNVHEFFNDLIMTIVQKTPCFSILSAYDNPEFEHYVMTGLLPKEVPVKTRMCKGGGNAADLAHQALKDGSVCWKSHIDNALFIDDVKYTFESKSWDSFLKKYCPRIRNATGCIGDFLDAFQQCVDTKQSVTITSNKNVMTELVNYLCHNDGERIIEFIKENGVECLMSENDEIQKCLAAGNYAVATAVDMSLLMSNEDFAPQSYSKEECTSVLSVDTCIYKTMKKCPKSSPAELVHNLFTTLAKQTPCLDVKPSGSSPVALTSLFTVSISLLSIVGFHLYR